jgi:GMP synthase (glutamine-hydrolysing)
MSILVVRHEPFEHLGRFAEILTQKNIPFFYRDLGEPSALGAGALDAGALDTCQGVIIMGGPQSANDSLPGLVAELKLIERVVAAGTPVLGICLGAQLIAKALGARVYRNPEKEIGWAPVCFTEAAAHDPVFGGVASPSTFFHWHGETFDLPAGAQWLAYSDKCRHQAYRFGTNVYGVQFHPEITPEMIVDWSAQPANCGDVESLEAAIDPHAADTAPLARRMLEGWLGVGSGF